MLPNSIESDKIVALFCIAKMYNVDNQHSGRMNFIPNLSRHNYKKPRNLLITNNLRGFV